MTNHQAFLRVADAIEAETERFHMNCWLRIEDRNLCGTVGCIAGTAVALDQATFEAWKKGGVSPVFSSEANEIAALYPEPKAAALINPLGAHLLGIKDGDAHYLFTSPHWWFHAYEHLGLDLPRFDPSDIELTPVESLDWIDAKSAATVCRAIGEGRLAISDVQFHYNSNRCPNCQFHQHRF